MQNADLKEQIRTLWNKIFVFIYKNDEKILTFGNIELEKN